MAAKSATVLATAAVVIRHGLVVLFVICLDLAAHTFHLQRGAKVVLDEIAHGSLALSSCLVLTQWGAARYQGLEISGLPLSPMKSRLAGYLICCMLGCIIDIDHFLQGIWEHGSLSFFAATHLQHKCKIGHSIFVVPLIGLCGYSVVGASFRTSLYPQGMAAYYGLLAALCVSTHIIRDAYKHGLYLWPLPTRIMEIPVPYGLIMASTFLLPFAASLLYQYASTSKPRRSSERTDIAGSLIHV
jgi:hypothetical protein